MALLGIAATTACSNSGALGPESDPCTEAVLAYADEPAQTGNVRHVHDPAAFRHGEYYYVFSTNDGIPIRRSRDLIHWEWVGRVFPNQLPPWASGAIPGVQAPWAPDVAFFNERYHLYYSLSTFGSQRSAIGLTVNATLDPDDPDYHWDDQGRVLESRPGVSTHNAIDPTVVFDDTDTPWLAWGSWSGGIMIRKVDPATGMPSQTDPLQHLLATRTALFSQNSIEGPYILRRGEYYYLFVSFDLCCRGVESTYNVRVGRARAVTGPYIDVQGVPMTQGGGTPILTAYGRVRGPGHGAVLTTAGGEHFFVHHYYDPYDGGVPQLQVRRIYWDADDWPLIGEPYAGPKSAPPPSVASVSGEWGYWHDGDPARRIRLRADGTSERCNGSGTWTLQGLALTLTWQTINGTEQVVRGVVSPEGGWFVGRQPDGRPVRAFKTGIAAP